jgi:IclR family pca regulon transcriptional regulator
MTSGSARPRYFVQALSRGLALLEVFDEHRRELTLSELARALDTNKPTARRLAQTLVDLGYLTNGPGKRFRLGPRALDLGRRYLAAQDLPDAARPILQALSEATGESSNLAIRDGREVVYLVRIPAAPRILSVNLQVGSRLPLHATSLGKALLADVAESDLTAILGESPWPACTERTRRSPQALWPDLLNLRTYGYAVSDEELEPGLRSIAAPVRNADGAVVASVNLSTHAARVPLDRLLGPLAEALLAARDRLDARLGYVPEQPSLANPLPHRS